MNFSIIQYSALLQLLATFLLAPVNSIQNDGRVSVERAINCVSQGSFADFQRELKWKKSKHHTIVTIQWKSDCVSFKFVLHCCVWHSWYRFASFYSIVVLWAKYPYCEEAGERITKQIFSLFNICSSIQRGKERNLDMVHASVWKQRSVAWKESIQLSRIKVCVQHAFYFMKKSSEIKARLWFNICNESLFEISFNNIIESNLFTILKQHDLFTIPICIASKIVEIWCNAQCLSDTLKINNHFLKEILHVWIF